MALLTPIEGQRTDLAALLVEIHLLTVSQTRGNSFDSKAATLGTIDRVAASTTVPAAATWVIVEVSATPAIVPAAEM